MTCTCKNCGKEFTSQPQGGHRVLCGDATSAEAVARLMGGQNADFAFLDPPYNCDYAGYTEEHLTIQNDRMSDGDFKRFLESSFRSLRAAIKPGASLYVCHSSSWQREFQNALETAGFGVRCQLIWAKNTFASASAGTNSSTNRFPTATSQGRGIHGTAISLNQRFGGKQTRGQPAPSDHETGRVGRASASQ